MITELMKRLILLGMIGLMTLWVGVSQVFAQATKYITSGINSQTGVSTRESLNCPNFVK